MKQYRPCHDVSSIKVQEYDKGSTVLANSSSQGRPCFHQSCLRNAFKSLFVCLFLSFFLKCCSPVLFGDLQGRYAIAMFAEKRLNDNGHLRDGKRGLRGWTGSQDTVGTGSQDTVGIGSQDTVGTGSQDTVGTGSQDTVGTGSQSGRASVGFWHLVQFTTSRSKK